MVTSNHDLNTNNGPPPRIELWSATDSEVDTDHVWGDSTTQQQEQAPSPDSDVPAPLRLGVSYVQDERNPWDDTAKGPSMAPSKDEPPEALRPGPSRAETNPFKRKPVPPVVSSTASSPGPQPPTDAFSQLKVNDEPSEPSTNPWQPALDASSTPPPSQIPHHDSASDIWGAAPLQPKPYLNPNLSTPALIAAQSTGNSQPWDEDLPEVVTTHPVSAQPSLLDEHAWDDEGTSNKGKESMVTPAMQVQPGTMDDWNLIDHEPTPESEPEPGNISKHSTWENFEDAEDGTAREEAGTERQPAEGIPPALPPRNEAEPPVQPPRSAERVARESETYQIKNINWLDAKSKHPRKSPILVQNANGPCPLVALVNALTLTTPADQTSSNLVETLRSREQISLNFLLEAVVDELMSSRHVDSDVPLPDMSELYAFLQGLHTGMNVNPRFVPAPEAVALYKRTSLTHLHPSDRDVGIPGTFEDTRDMKLYATFAIPLIHGWLAPGSDPVSEAFKRQASSYDDAQNLLFREEELEHKFSNSPTGLTTEEQQLYQDIISIKSFLSLTATQLTPFGLDIVTKAIRPGGVSILFRNDHFSTLYRHPQTLQLFTLVTDAGYFTHDEVVWESLVDVRGERAEFFSGDFRVVGGTQRRANDVPNNWYDDAAPDDARGGEWQTVQNRRARNNRQAEPTVEAPPSSPREQEDRDLALAMQLQEEEDARQRQEQAARRRESQLSEQYLEQQGRNGNPPASDRNRNNSINSTNRGSSSSLPPPRGSSVRGGRPAQQQQVRSLIPPRTRRPTDDEEDAPPSYEQASKSIPYVPPAGHPSHPQSSNSPQSSGPRRATVTAGTGPGPSTPSRAARHSVQSSGSGRDRDCIVM
ncbi:hypothetical protein F5Y16DRAFT_163776 [Xylariaceae sp. FL0255]|nr:hypothetical protein F5Y16DRAFT_163776 [Xylariaceae sp. FL0255]